MTLSMGALCLRLGRHKREPASVPFLLLAPMENLADWRFRRAFARSVGGCDEMCTEFLR